MAAKSATETLAASARNGRFFALRPLVLCAANGRPGNWLSGCPEIAEVIRGRVRSAMSDLLISDHTHIANSFLVRSCPDRPPATNVVEQAAFGRLVSFWGSLNASKPANFRTNSMTSASSCGMRRISISRLRMIVVASALAPVSLCAAVNHLNAA